MAALVDKRFAMKPPMAAPDAMRDSMSNDDFGDDWLARNWGFGAYSLARAGRVVGVAEQASPLPAREVTPATCAAPSAE